MKFGPAPVASALGAISAHAVRAGEARLKKGQRIGAAEQAALQAAGVESVIVAEIEPGDIVEDEAAKRLAKAIAGPHLRLDPPFTGRVNLYAEVAGLLKVARARVDAVNRIDDAITVATLPEYAPVAEGRHGGDGEDHPLRDLGGGAGGGLRGGGRGGGVGRALSPAADRRRLDAAAGAEDERRQQDARRPGGAARAGAGADRRGAPLRARQRGAGRDAARRRADAATRSSCSAPRRSPTGAT